MIHSIKIDEYISDKLKEFNDKLPVGETVVSFNSSGDYLFIHTEEASTPRSSERHLLLEEFDPKKAKARFKRG